MHLIPERERKKTHKIASKYVRSVKVFVVFWRAFIKWVNHTQRMPCVVSNNLLLYVYFTMRLWSHHSFKFWRYAIRAYICLFVYINISRILFLRFIHMLRFFLSFASFQIKNNSSTQERTCLKKKYFVWRSRWLTLCFSNLTIFQRFVEVLMCHGLKIIYTVLFMCIFVVFNEYSITFSTAVVAFYFTFSTVLFPFFLFSLSKLCVFVYNANRR